MCYGGLYRNLHHASVSITKDEHIKRKLILYVVDIMIHINISSDCIFYFYVKMSDPGENV